MVVDGFTSQILGKPLKETKANAIIKDVNKLLVAWGRPDNDNG